MNVAMFIVGFCIFSLYISFLFWNIIYQNKKQREDGNGTKDYYRREYIKPKANKIKSGSQSRKKNYHWHNESKLNGQ